MKMHSAQSPRFSSSDPSPTSAPPCKLCASHSAETFTSLSFSSEHLEQKNLTPEEFQSGEHYWVIKAPESVDDPSVRRLIALGFVQGTRFNVVQSGNPMILSFRGSKIGLDTRVLSQHSFSRTEPIELLDSSASRHSS